MCARKHQNAMSKHSEDDVAYHEAGHAVVAFFLGLSISRHGVTIVPSKDYLGVTHIPNKLAENPEYARSGKTKLRIEKLAIMFRAGDIAERKHNPECRRDDRQDRGNATDLLRTTLALPISPIS